MAGAIIYNKYSENDVFKDKRVNVICNQLMQGLLNIKFTDFNLNFALSGEAADAYRNNTPGPIQNVKFHTKSREIYITIAKELHRFCPALVGMEAFEERITARFESVILEFYPVESLITENMNGIYVESITES